MKLVRALIIASHPIPSLAVTAMATLLTAEAAPAGFGAGRVVLVALAVLAGQLSVGWSNDAIDADRDAGRADKPAAVGLVSARALWLGAAIALAASLALAAALGPVSLVIDAAMTAVAWSYNLGLKSTVWSGATYAVAFGLLPSFSASALPGHPLARWPVTVAAALLGLGAHFANVLPDLAEDARNGVRGLPQRLAGALGPIATRAAALALLLGASVLLVIAASPGRRWAAIAVAASLALAAALGPVSLVIDAAMTAVAWSYNLGLKSTVWSGATYAVAFGLLPSFSASALPGHPLARWPVTIAAALLGLGAHFANVLPDLAEDARNGVRGLPQRLASRSGPIATRSAALALLLGASALLLVAASPGRRWAAIVGLCCSGVLAVVGARGRGQVPFLAAIGIAGVNVALFAAGVEALTSGPHLAGALG